MALSPEQERLLAERYGVKQRTAGRRRRQVLASIGGVAVLILATYWFSSANYNPLSYEVVSFEIVDEWQMRVEFEVSAPIGTEVSCDLQGLDSSFGVVAHKTVNLAGSATEVSRYAVDLRTSAKAVTGVVDLCRTNSQ